MIVFVNCFSFGTIFAGENNKLNSGITFTYNTKKYEASKKEIQEYEKYGIKDKELNVNYFIDLYGKETDNIFLDLIKFLNIFGISSLLTLLKKSFNISYISFSSKFGA